MSPIELSWTAKKEKHKRQIDFSLKKCKWTNIDDKRWITQLNWYYFPLATWQGVWRGGEVRVEPHLVEETPDLLPQLHCGEEENSYFIIISLRGWELRYPICCTRTVGFDLIQLDCIAQTRRPIKGIDSQSQVQVQDVKLFCSVDPGEQLDCDESRPCSRSGHFQLSDLQKDFQVSSFEQSIAIILCHLLHLLP